MIATDGDTKKICDLDPEKALKPTVWDGLNTVGQAGINATAPLLPLVGGVPGASSVIAGLFDAITGPVLARRRDEFLTDLHGCLVRLEENVEGFSIESLASNEGFATIIVQATRAAMGTHQQEKRKALRNAVLNTAIRQRTHNSGQLDEEESLLLRLMDQIEPLQARLLHFMRAASDLTLDFDGKMWFPGAVECKPDGTLTVADTNLAFASIIDHVCERWGYEGCYFWIHLRGLYNLGLVRIGGPHDEEAKAEFVRMVFDKHYGATSGPVGVTDTANLLLRFIASPFPDEADEAPAACLEPLEPIVDDHHD